MMESPENAPRPDLSVVVAVTNGADSTEACVESLLRASAGFDVEVILSGPEDLLGGISPDSGIRTVSCPAEARGPRLWGAGIAAARGRIIAVTEVTTTFDTSWVRGILETHASYPRAEFIVGGAVEPSPDGTLTYWAAYFFDYSDFMLPFEEVEAAKLAGTNITWRSGPGTERPDTTEPEFWKTQWVEARRRQGTPVVITPRAVAYSCRSWAPASVARLQYHQGRCYGGMRRSSITMGNRLIYTVGMLILPFVLTGRTAATVIRKRRHMAALVASFPMLFVIATAWSLGEMTGYLFGAGRSCRHVR